MQVRCGRYLMAVLLLLSGGEVTAGSVTVDHIDGTFMIGDTTCFDVVIPVVFYIRFTNDQSSNVGGFTNGFEVGFGAGGSFSPIVAEELIPDTWDMFFPLIHDIDYFSVDGTDLDTAGTYGSKQTNSAMPPGFSAVAYSISTMIPASEVGKTFCIDSCYFPPSGTWLWAPGGPPSWNGPICHEVRRCCVGVRGNVDGDPSEEITISDLVYLVTYMFGSGPRPPCMGEADFMDDGSPDIQDLVTLVQYMFQGGPPPPPCPE